MTRRRAQQRQGGFTLAEASIAIGLMGVIFIVTIAVFITMSQGAIRTQAQVSASMDASVATQAINADAREAVAMALPNETGFVSPTGYSAANFETTYSGANVYTAVCITKPGTGSPSTGTTITFAGCTNPVTVYNRSATGISLVYYRSDANGVPDASAGSYVWEWSSDGSISKAIIKSVSASAPNSVQFERPASSIASTEVSVKIVSGYYSPINTDTNEATNGHYTTTLTGTCVRMRDYSTTPPSTPPVTGEAWAGY
ncbi:MAG: hypothetical protein P4L33_08570 [Capsulimonadaceae bacterium]|nr:hypothetical protein [Capsulimonadaceae bacterium]